MLVYYDGRPGRVRRHPWTGHRDAAGRERAAAHRVGLRWRSARLPACIRRRARPGSRASWRATASLACADVDKYCFSNGWTGAPEAWSDRRLRLSGARAISTAPIAATRIIGEATRSKRLSIGSPPTQPLASASRAITRSCERMTIPTKGETSRQYRRGRRAGRPHRSPPFSPRLGHELGPSRTSAGRSCRRSWRSRASRTPRTRRHSSSPKRSLQPRTSRSPRTRPHAADPHQGAPTHLLRSGRRAATSPHRRAR